MMYLLTPYWIFACEMLQTIFVLKYFTLKKSTVITF